MNKQSMSVTRRGQAIGILNVRFIFNDPSRIRIVEVKDEQSVALVEREYARIDNDRDPEAPDIRTVVFTSKQLIDNELIKDQISYAEHWKLD